MFRNTAWGSIILFVFSPRWQRNEIGQNSRTSNNISRKLSASTKLKITCYKCDDWRSASRRGPTLLGLLILHLCCRNQVTWRAAQSNAESAHGVRSWWQKRIISCTSTRMQSTVTIMVQLTLLTLSRNVVVVLLDLDSTTTLCLCRDVKIRNRPQIRTTTGYLYKPSTTHSLTGHELSGINGRTTSTDAK